MLHLGLEAEWMKPDEPGSGSDGPDMLKSATATMEHALDFKPALEAAEIWCRRRIEENPDEVVYCIPTSSAFRMWLGDHGFRRAGNGWYYPNASARPHIHIAIEGGHITYIGMTRGGNNGAIYTFFNGGLINDELPPQTAVVHEDLLHAGIGVMLHLGLEAEWMKPDEPGSGSDGPDMLTTGLEDHMQCIFFPRLPSCQKH